MAPTTGPFRVSRRTSILICTLLLVVGFAPAAFSANLSIPDFELITRGQMTGGTFELGTRANVSLLFDGGYKFGGRMWLTLTDNDIASLLSAPATGAGTTTQLAYLESAIGRAPLFAGAEIIARSVFGSIFDLTYFAGQNDVFASGAIFPDVFGTQPISTTFTGYMYFPDTPSGGYDGIYQVDGTGLKISTTAGQSQVLASAYFYQDAYLGAGKYSADAQIALNLPRLKMEGFVGGSFPEATYGYYRAGLFFFYDTGTLGQFLAQVGIPRWAPAPGRGLSGDNFYLLFEPRIRFNPLSIFLTFFWHPGYYDQQPTGESGNADINVKFLLGNPYETVASGGIESTVSMSLQNTSQPSIQVSPYFTLNTGGVRWDAKVNVHLIPFSLSNILEAFIGVKTEF